MNQKEIVNKLLNSSHLRQIYFYAIEKEYFMQKDLRKKIDIKYPAHISKSLKELRELNILYCENPNDKNFKRYQITPTAKNIEKEVRRYL